MTTFSSSILSASFGMTKFLLFGPCRILSKNALFGGYGGLKFIVLFLNMLCTLLAKGLFLPLSSHRSYLGSAASIPDIDRGGAIIFTLIWISFNLLPQLIYVSSISLHSYLPNFWSVWLISIHCTSNNLLMPTVSTHIKGHSWLETTFPMNLIFQVVVYVI